MICFRLSQVRLSNADRARWLSRSCDPIDFACGHDVVVNGAHFRRCVFVFDQSECGHEGLPEYLRAHLQDGSRKRTRLDSAERRCLAEAKGAKRGPGLEHLLLREEGLHLEERAEKGAKLPGLRQWKNALREHPDDDFFGVRRMKFILLDRRARES